VWFQVVGEDARVSESASVLSVADATTSTHEIVVTNTDVEDVQDLASDDDVPSEEAEVAEDSVDVAHVAETAVTTVDTATPVSAATQDTAASAPPPPPMPTAHAKTKTKSDKHVAPVKTAPVVRVASARDRALDEIRGGGAKVCLCVRVHAPRLTAHTVRAQAGERAAAYGAG
jgi:hypothetical protein